MVSRVTLSGHHCPSPASLPAVHPQDSLQPHCLLEVGVSPGGPTEAGEMGTLSELPPLPHHLPLADSVPQSFPPILGGTSYLFWG